MSTILHEQAKNRRAGVAQNPDTLKDFTRGVAAVSEQAANILDYLKNKLAPVNPLESDDVQGFMRDSEMRQTFARLDRRSQEKMLLSMHSGKHQELADALRRANAVCSGLDTEQLKRPYRIGERAGDWRGCRAGRCGKERRRTNYSCPNLV